MRTDIIILAAGSSSRMGVSKQLLEIDGEPLLVRAVKISCSTTADRVVVVLGANEEAHRRMLHGHTVEIISNNGWATGMGSSIKAGLQALLHALPGTEAAIITVCDQPLLRREHLQALMDTAQQGTASIVASWYAGAAGVPALFTRLHFGELLQLDDAQGAKKVLQHHAPRLVTVDFAGGSVDLDTEDDVKEFLKTR